MDAGRGKFYDSDFYFGLMLFQGKDFFTLKKFLVDFSDYTDVCVL